jgi:hypothetical protein
MAAPSSLGITGYHTIYKEDPPEDIISLISHLSKDILILEIAGLNYRVSGGVARKVDTSLQRQQNELFWFSGKDRNLYSKYIKLILDNAGGSRINLFSRAQCLYALEQIIQSDIPIIEGFSMTTPNSWEPLLKYLLAVNTVITKIGEDHKDEPINFETLSPKLLPLNEVMILNDPFFIVNRGQELLRYLANHAEVGQYLKDYVKEVYQLTPDEFIFQIYSLNMANSSDTKDLEFHYQVSETHKFKYLFDILSGKFDNSDHKTLLNIKKNPFYKWETNRYILTDQNFLLEKAYYQFINDFYFDKLKGAAKGNGGVFTMQDYKSIIGRFFEYYIDSILKYCFYNATNFIFKTNEELKIKVHNQPDELCDVYLRDHSKVLIGEIKSTSIYDKEKYSGDVDVLYKNDRNKFFKDFGIDQVIKGIKFLSDRFLEKDPGLEQLKKIIVYPVIFLNEKAFQTPLMSTVFNDRFSELTKQINDSRIYIYPLTLIHISELEQMQQSLRKNPDSLWKTIEANFRQKDGMIPPFYTTINRLNIKYNYKIIIPKLLWMLKRFNP